MPAPFTVIYDGRDRKKFLHARNAGIGASDIAAVLGFSKWRTPRDVWLDKTGRAEPRDMTEPMEFGIALEAPIARRFQVRHGRRDSATPIGKMKPSPGVLQSTKYPWLLATPDRIVERFDDGLEVPLEIKTQNAFGASDWDPAPPLYYQAQSQAQQLVWFGDDDAPSRAHGLIVPLIGGNTMPLPAELPFDRDFAEYMIEDVGKWWRDYVVADKEPPLTLGDDVAAICPPDPELTVTADAAMLTLIRERVALQPRMSADKKRDDEIKAQLKLFMGSATSIVDEDGRVLLTWALPKTPPKTEKVVDLPALAAAHPAIVAEFTTEQLKAQSRTMLFSK